ncbi:MAG: hypothetical protein DRP46_04270 [Candidatus Zixiibacteriota bacterium]|nr:MAG: hypothetical protein DRP46_04270 [candidate division Zixibacteria bacterium]
MDALKFRFSIFTITIIVFLWGASMGQQEEDSARAEIFENVKSLIENQDFFRAVAFIQGLGEPDEVAKAYENLVLDFYWKKKSVADMSAFARSGLQYCLTEAEALGRDDPELAKKLKVSARRISYNLASFTWPGWDEKGIVITASDIAIGLDAARLNVRLVDELNEGDTPHSIACWGLGAQLIAVQEYDKALEEFKKSKEYARNAADELSELLADGYIGITMIISGDESGQDILGEAIKRLNDIGSEDALYFVEQFNTVMNVFIK